MRHRGRKRKRRIVLPPVKPAEDGLTALGRATLRWGEADFHPGGGAGDPPPEYVTGQMKTGPATGVPRIPAHPNCRNVWIGPMIGSTTTTSGWPPGDKPA